MSVCSLVIRGSGVGVLLHKCSRLNGSKGVVSCTLGSLTRLWDSGSLSESSSFRSGISGLASRDGARVRLAKLVLQLSRPSTMKIGVSRLSSLL